MSDSELVKQLTNSATLNGLPAGIEWIAEKVIEESITSDPNCNLTYYVKFVVVIAASIAAKRYLEYQKSSS